MRNNISRCENVIFYISFMKIWVQILGLALLILFFFSWHVETIPYRECCQCTFPLTVGISIPNYCRASYPVRQCGILYKFLLKEWEKFASGECLLDSWGCWEFIQQSLHQDLSWRQLSLMEPQALWIEVPMSKSDQVVVTGNVHKEAALFQARLWFLWQTEP